jgi:hypothetical protein
LKEGTFSKFKSWHSSCRFIGFAQLGIVGSDRHQLSQKYVQTDIETECTSFLSFSSFSDLQVSVIEPAIRVLSDSCVAGSFAVQLAKAETLLHQNRYKQALSLIEK